MFKGQIATGTFTSDGAARNIECGFTPAYVKVYNATSRDMLEWQDTMTAGHAEKTVAVGTRTHITSEGISPYAGVRGSNAKGFTIGADADVNATTETVHWLAFGPSE